MLDDLVHEYMSQEGRTNHHQSVLKRLQEYTEDQDKDFAQLTSADIAAILAMFNSSSEYIVRKYRFLLQQFLQWVSKKGINVDTSLNSILQYTLQNVNQSISFKSAWHYGSYHQMIQCFNYYAQETELTNPDKYAACLTLAWFGVSREVASKLEIFDITSRPNSFEIKNLLTITDSQAVRVLNTELYSTGYFMKDGRYRRKQRSNEYLQHFNSIPRSLSISNKLTEANHYFAYEEIGQSGLYSAAYAVLESMMIPVRKNTYQEHPQLIADLVKIPDYASAHEHSLARTYFPFYEWCKVFRTVSD